MAHLLLGSNIGEREIFLQKAISEIEKSIGTIIKKSPVYKTKAWGNRKQNDFLNKAILVETKLSPQNLLNEILKIEELLGRVRKKKWKDRTIDIDMLFYDDLIIDEPGLKIPHPLLHQRKFALIPLNKIASDFVHPVFKKTVSELLKECNDELIVKKIVR